MRQRGSGGLSRAAAPLDCEKKKSSFHVEKFPLPAPPVARDGGDVVGGVAPVGGKQVSYSVGCPGAHDPERARPRLTLPRRPAPLL